MKKKTDSFEMLFGYPLEMERAKCEEWPILLPVGTMEYHSDHCPYGCDSLTAVGLAQRLAAEVNAVIMPPIYYGVSSYAVGGPETNTIHVDCDTLENYVYCVLKSMFRSGIHKNIFIIIGHQTEDLNPMELACRKAARKLVFEYLEETAGTGWWGKRENKDFYENLTGKDNPWNWVRILHSQAPSTHHILSPDHAGVCESSLLEALFPGSIKLDRLGLSRDWFAESAVEMSPELGEKCIAGTVEEYLHTLCNEV
jgi:creatinine amidohydrolase